MSKNQINLKSKKIELTIEQKKEICLFASDNPWSKQNYLCIYFSEKFEQNIPTTTMSDILKNRKNYLNSESINSYRIRNSKYPELEDALFLWFNEKRFVGLPISDDILISKANEFGIMLNIKDFKYSTGWLDKFKKRNHISNIKLHGESGKYNRPHCFKNCKPSDILPYYFNSNAWMTAIVFRDILEKFNDQIKIFKPNRKVLLRSGYYDYICSAKEFIESDESESTSELLSDDDIVRIVRSASDVIEEEIQVELEAEKIPFDKAFEGFKISSSFNDKDSENLSYFKNRRSEDNNKQNLSTLLIH
ncbi:Tigger transposable element-derived [Brachionus plicatilis]|uniref:Tigger transposable element-derived n=1 Tax=Brachionus plicatilis TaxID=10195 RepID=A0A3M7SEI3_BRAPC|nr:Tigger transposable element-derived [Brachionus plicatilis]